MRQASRTKDELTLGHKFTTGLGKDEISRVSPALTWLLPMMAPSVYPVMPATDVGLQEEAPCLHCIDVGSLYPSSLLHTNLYLDIYQGCISPHSPS